MKSGIFNFEDLTVSFGGSLSKPHNIFEAKAIKVPDYKYSYKERECLGNGWYSTGKTKITKIQSNAYVIVKDKQVLGVMFPNNVEHKTFLIPVRLSHKKIRDFIETLNL